MLIDPTHNFGWLLEGEPWVKYRTYIDLLHQGNDFRKLKAPLVWYDILHVLEVLSQFPWLRQDERLLAMLVTVKAKADPEGYYVPESTWTAWKDWDFGQKRAPSRWLTFLVWRSIERLRSSPWS